MNTTGSTSNNHLTEILLDLAEHDVHFIVCGGVAAVLHGVERMTADLDLALDFEEPNVSIFLSRMEALNLRPRVPVPAEVISNPRVRTRLVEEKDAVVFTFVDAEQPFRQVDVFLTASHSYSTLAVSAEHVLVKDVKIRILTIQKLIELKEAISPAREKDQFDIAELRRILPSMK